MTTYSVRVAVVGAGPSGIYAIEKLLALDEITVDLYERLPAPFGLLRYGVAPDHLKIKASIGLFHAILDNPRVRFFGNVEVGTDIAVDDLRRAYDAVFFAFGASQGRALGVAGEQLTGSYTATEFVNWYNGHPDSEPERFELDGESVAIVGMGNVAVDVARILGKSAEELRHTDLPSQVLGTLRRSKVRDIHVIARRGPVHAKFSLPALMELGELRHADLIVNAGDLVLDDLSARLVDDNRRVRQRFELLQQLAAQPPTGRRRRIHLHFFCAPARVEGAAGVTGLLVDRMALDASGELYSTGHTRLIPAQMVIRSVGYRGSRLDGLPFDDVAGVVPNENGRVLTDGVVTPGLYVTGWIRRGPQGVIGTNRADAAEVVARFAAGKDELTEARRHESHRSASKTVIECRTPVVDWAGWTALDAAEIAMGEPTGARRTKIQSRAQMLEIAGARQLQEGAK